MDYSGSTVDAIYLKNTMLPGSYVLPICRIHIPDVVEMIKKEAVKSERNLCIINEFEPEKPPTMYIVKEGGQCKDSVIVVIDEVKWTRLPDFYPAIVICDVGDFVKMVGKIHDDRCKKDGCDHIKYMQEYRKNSIKTVLAASMLHRGEDPENIKRYIDIDGDGLIQADMFRVMMRARRVVGKTDMRNHLGITPYMEQYLQRFEEWFSPSPHEIQDGRPLSYLRYETYIVTYEHGTPGCCAINEFEHLADFDEITDRMNRDNPEAETACIACTSSSLRNYGFAKFAETTEEYLETATIMQPCYQHMECNYCLYMQSMAEYSEIVKFLSKCCTNDKYHKDPKEYMSGIYSIGRMQGMIYKRMAELKTGGDEAEFSRIMEEYFDNDISREIIESVAEELKARARIEKEKEE